MKSILLFSAVLFSFSAFNQTQGIAYSAVGKGVATTFVTDYHCLGINTSALGWGTGYSGWAKTPDIVRVEYLGEAKPGTAAGVILASFNAG